MSNKPIPLDQSWPTRVGLMKLIYKKIFSTPITALEIGVWFGVGSTRILLESLQPKSKIYLVDSWKKYASMEDLKNESWDWEKMDGMMKDAFKSTIDAVFEFEAQNGDNFHEISIIRGNAKNSLSIIQPETFDLIYIDGDHKYKAVKEDIVQAKKLINRKYGLVCGDDLEIMPTSNLIEEAKKNLNIDFIESSIDGNGYHPGVALAVHEEFGEVNMINGFWWIMSIDGEFTTNVFPKHLFEKNT